MLAEGAGGSCLDIFFLNCHFSLLSPSLWETARYSLKYYLKGPLNPNQPPTKINSKAIKSHCKGPYNKQNLTLVVISYEIYETHRRLVSQASLFIGILVISFTYRSISTLYFILNNYQFNATKSLKGNKHLNENLSIAMPKIS